jgi:hypothetical protein
MAAHKPDTKQLKAKRPAKQGRTPPVHRSPKASGRRKSASRKAGHAGPSARPRMKLADAMRSVGLDETKLAEKLDRMVDRLDRGKHEKLLLEALKECLKHIEEAASRGSAGSGPVPVVLITCVPRPAREEKPAAKTEPEKEKK